MGLRAKFVSHALGLSAGAVRESMSLWASRVDLSKDVNSFPYPLLPPPPSLPGTLTPSFEQ